MNTLPVSVPRCACRPGYYCPDCLAAPSPLLRRTDYCTCQPGVKCEGCVAWDRKARTHREAWVPPPDVAPVVARAAGAWPPRPGKVRCGNPTCPKRFVPSVQQRPWVVQGHRVYCGRRCQNQFIARMRTQQRRAVRHGS